MDYSEDYNNINFGIDDGLGEVLDDTDPSEEMTTEELEHEDN